MRCDIWGGMFRSILNLDLNWQLLSSSLVNLKQWVWTHSKILKLTLCCFLSRGVCYVLVTFSQWTEAVFFPQKSKYWPIGTLTTRVYSVFFPCSFICMVFSNFHMTSKSMCDFKYIHETIKISLSSSNNTVKILLMHESNNFGTILINFYFFSWTSFWSRSIIT